MISYIYISSLTPSNIHTSHPTALSTPQLLFTFSALLHGSVNLVLCCITLMPGVLDAAWSFLLHKLQPSKDAALSLQIAAAACGKSRKHQMACCQLSSVMEPGQWIICCKQMQWDISGFWSFVWDALDRFLTQPDG